MGTIESSETTTLAEALRAQRTLTSEEVERVESAHQAFRAFPAYRHEAH